MQNILVAPDFFFGGVGVQTQHEPKGTPYIYTYYEQIVCLCRLIQSPVLSLLNTVIEYFLQVDKSKK